MANYSSNSSIIEKSTSRVQTYMSHVYGWMTVGLLLTALVAWYASTNLQLLQLLYRGMWVLLIAELGLVFVISGFINRLSGAAATTLFMLYSVLNGCTFSIYFIVYTSSSIASVFFITAGMFAAMAFYGYTTKRDLSAFGRFLFMGLIGIVIASLVNLFLKSEPLMWAVTYIGVFVFAGLTAYDNQKLKELGENISYDDQNVFRRFVILGALTLYLDFINLFIMLLRIFGDRR
ncbi:MULTISPECIES: Bax inhibitor-1 family protein [unclassified Gilliamella]|uniref:Bax inhibitor-1/YccA family protein n=1 Tax=unclassified Gilliamella TaxID=2685620 RepID=UPI00226A3373|nr:MULTISPECIES: Bax inhibitor-1/YccA family protein [unclassified Gilliamella]MCX8642045.1 Bax inhibitor-1/YccA family protein [Gilliamella sp. B3835]MCX8707231.1 Bax inhibitor-1/YccA family protein [Gilliamella sp. B3783]MCX8710860.1 Bax inhibitor-1/YccA family protein [Gilliamella sp. B3780]MCX8714028.1 Bax inhibitor-1/YccA family protein [Gilliamella sp. B3781]MCX8716213.1 Bax inhibitor-1/YccA family protein [Gilliamella sp. B3784]